MKRTILTSIMVVGMLSSKAQETITTDSFKPQAGEKQFTFGLFNNSAFFVIKKYKKPKLATRFGLSGYYAIESANNTNTYPSNSYSDPYYTLSMQESTIRRQDFRLDAFLGFQRSFGDYKNLEPYIGIDFSIGNSSQKRRNISKNEMPNSQAVYITETNNLYSSQLNPSASILPFIGFNYYLGERFALGAEYKITIFNFTYSAKNTSETYTRFSDGNSSSTNKDDSHTFRANGNLTGSAYVTATLFIGGVKK